MSYEDILYRAHPVSGKRGAMPMIDRAAQFAPFAALTGHDGLIREAARHTDSAMELTDSAVAELDQIIRWLKQGMQVQVTYFVPDLRKKGGMYVEHMGTLRRVDGFGQCLLFLDGTVIPFQSVAALEVVG